MSEPGDVGFELPDARDLSVVEAGRLWDKIDRAATEANARAVRLKQHRAAVKDLAIRVVEASGQTSARVPLEDGREIQMTPYDWEVFAIKDEGAFKEWAAEFASEGGEDFYDSSPKLREGIFLDYMRMRSQSRQPLPPGVTRWSDVRISRTAAA